MAGWYVSPPSVAKASGRSTVTDTGTFGAFRRPESVGVSDAVRQSTRALARRAKRAERRWNGEPQTKSAIHDRIARMEARRASEGK